jgi:hypothetical protein
MLGLAALSSKVPHLSVVVAGEIVGGQLLKWPDGSLLQQWGRSTVKPLLLRLLLPELPRFKLWSTALVLLLLWSVQLTPGGVYTIQYLGGATLELPLPAHAGIIFFLFFSSASATAFIILS